MNVAVCDLVVEVCELIERSQALETADAGLAETGGCLRVALLAALDDCDDQAVIADGQGALAELDAVLARLEVLPSRLPLSA